MIGDGQARLVKTVSHYRTQLFKRDIFFLYDLQRIPTYQFCGFLSDKKDLNRFKNENAPLLSKTNQRILEETLICIALCCNLLPRPVRLVVRKRLFTFRGLNT